jgi:hypothetical protein
MTTPRPGATSIAHLGGLLPHNALRRMFAEVALGQTLADFHAKPSCGGVRQAT